MDCLGKTPEQVCEKMKALVIDGIKTAA
jgi:hypothetical protein